MTDRSIESELYYHGLLPEEDIRVLLKRNGDFLVRTAESKAGQTRCFVLSVMYDETREEAGIKHYVIQNRGGKFFIESFGFDTIPEMIHFHQMQQVSINKVFSMNEAVIIRNAIPRALEVTEWALPEVRSSYITALEHGCSACSSSLNLDYGSMDKLELRYNIAKASSFYEFVRLQSASNGKIAPSMSTMIRLAELLFKDYKQHVVDSLQLGTSA
uniref:SH2 domain-containing protein n=1 Tax=Ditylenchus dipsaci TaxID=166011 RepID=A0A915DSV7_9BILA